MDVSRFLQRVPPTPISTPCLDHTGVILPDDLYEGRASRECRLILGRTKLPTPTTRCRDFLPGRSAGPSYAGVYEIHTSPSTTNDPDSSLSSWWNVQ